MVNNNFYNKLIFKHKQKFLKDIKKYNNIIIFFDENNFISLHSRNLLTIIFEDLLLKNNCKPKQIWFLYNKNDIIKDSLLITINDSYKDAKYKLNINKKLIENEFILHIILYFYYYIVVYKKFKNCYLIINNNKNLIINNKIKLDLYINKYINFENEKIIEFYKQNNLT